MASPTSRIVGLDIARGLAVLGMFAAHLAPTEGEQIWDGRSSALFAVLAGVSLGLMTGGARPSVGSSRARDVVSVSLRGIVLIVVGLLLTELGTPIAVILSHYGVMFLIATLFLFAPRVVLIVLVVVFAVGGPVLVSFLSAAAPIALQSMPLETAQLASIPVVWFTEYYPVPSWLAYIAVGLLVARSDVSAARTRVLLIGGGAASVVLGYGGALVLGLDATPHSSTTSELLGAGGLALLVIGVLVTLTTPGPVPRAIATAISRILTPLSAVGALALTVYCGQIVALAVFLTAYPDPYDFDAWRSWGLLVAFMLVSIAFALVWRRFLGRGPLERLLGLLTLRPTTSDRTRPSVPTH